MYITILGTKLTKGEFMSISPPPNTDRKIDDFKFPHSDESIKRDKKFANLFFLDAQTRIEEGWDLSTDTTTETDAQQFARSFAMRLITKLQENIKALHKDTEQK